jgi:hypothetical protein
MPKQQPSVRIVVDVHERSSGIAVVLAEELGADVEIVSLPAGGVLVGLGRLIGIDSIVGRASR